MLQRTIACLCMTIAFLASAQERSAAPDPKHALEGEALLNALRGGGYTLYFRHTSSDFSQQDRPGMDATDCGAQRNLTREGRLVARRIGEAIAALRLPLGEVIASPYCRTMETGQLIAGRVTAEEVVRGRPGPTGAPDYSPLARILSTAPPSGSLRVIAGHGNPFRAIAGAPHLLEGEAAVVKPTGSDWIVVARLMVADWERLAEPAPGSGAGRRLAVTEDPAQRLEGAALVGALRAGGYTILLRHSETDLSQSDRPNYDLANCATQRNLSEAGRAQARRIGAAIAALGVPLGESLASPLCRTMDTARLIAGRVTADETVRGLLPEPNSRPGSGFARFTRMLASPPAPGSNRVVVGHVSAWEVIKGKHPLAEGEAVVLRGSGDGMVAVARLVAEDWEKLPR